jgi:formylglycine-generating enzyme required for sulfatase activity
MKRIFYSFVILMLLNSCISTKDTFVANDEKVKVNFPPGTVKISDNFYVDRTEMRNIDYLEYHYWCMRVLGAKSEEFLNSYPDTTVWKGLGLSQTDDMVRMYFRHPKYRNMPVVGLTIEQAMSYAKWRSNRVYEFLLIKNKMIEPQPNQNAENYFTIEKYLAGEYFDYVPDSSLPIPKYSLPSIDEWETLAAGGLDKAEYTLGYDTLKGKFKRLLKKNKFIFNTKEFSDYYSTDSSKVLTGDVNSFKPNKFDLYNTIGNIAEMTTSEGVAKGGSWYHPLEMANINNNILYKKPRNWLGFRCVCRWEFLVKEE